MNQAREEILHRIRDAYASSGRPSAQPAPVPPRPERPRPEVIDTFVEICEDYQAVVQRCSVAEVGEHVARILREGEVRTVVLPPGLDPAWTQAADGEHVVDDGLSSAALDTMDAVVTGATVGISRTGTIVLDHSEGQGRRALTLVPDLHICVIREEQVVDDVPAGVDALRASVDAGHALTWISGPSATSDIELDRVEGVHGPRNLHVIVAAG